MDEIAMSVALLFVAVSAADKKILEEEVFVMEKCAQDYGIEKEEWVKALNEAFILYFNEGDAAVSGSIQKLSRSLPVDQRKELAEDLLAIALADEVLNEKEKLILKMVCRGLDVHLEVPEEFQIDCV